MAMGNPHTASLSDLLQKRLLVLKRDLATSKSDKLFITVSITVDWVKSAQPAESIFLT